MSRARRLVIVPRHGADPADDWYPWFTALPEVTGTFVGGVELAPLLPGPAAPEIEPTSAALLDLIGTDTRGTALVGHGLGCQAAMRALEQMGATHRVAGFLAVGGWWRLGSEARAAELAEWSAPGLDLEAVRAAAGVPLVLLSDDDPQIDDPAGNASIWTERLDAEVRTIRGAGGFRREREPEALAAILARFG